MDRLFTPWRYSYISKDPAGEGCIFCEKAASSQDEENLVVHRGARNFILLNLFPYTNGHIMIAPYEHVASLEDAAEETAAEIMRLTRLAIVCLRRVYRPEGLNVGMNLGHCAGAGVAGHVHMHVLPRWTGDANFMTTTSETRVLPEDLPTTWRRLSEAFRASASETGRPV
jgi:ATP adenylyltransferase